MGGGWLSEQGGGNNGGCGVGIRGSVARFMCTMSGSFARY